MKNKPDNFTDIEAFRAMTFEEKFARLIKAELDRDNAVLLLQERCGTAAAERQQAIVAAMHRSAEANPAFN